jgi:predicted nucleic acid-binding Zn ribbon protein
MVRKYPCEVCERLVPLDDMVYPLERICSERCVDLKDRQDEEEEDEE